MTNHERAPEQPAYDLTNIEEKILEQAQANELPCPTCEAPLVADVVNEDDYSGVVLSCGCGFCEY